MKISDSTLVKTLDKVVFAGPEWEFLVPRKLFLKKMKKNLKKNFGKVAGIQL